MIETTGIAVETTMFHLNLHCLIYLCINTNNCFGFFWDFMNERMLNLGNLIVFRSGHASFSPLCESVTLVSLLNYLANIHTAEKNTMTN